MNNRRELIDKRTPTTKTFLKNDGIMEVEVYKDPIHYLENGEYQEIDNTLIKTDKGYKNKSNNFNVEFNNQDNKAIINLSCKDKKITMVSNNMILNSTSNDTITYTNKDIDIEYKVLSNQLKESIILNKIPEDNKFIFVINTDLILKLNEDNTISFIDNDKECYRIEKPYMVDKNNEYSELVKYEIEKLDDAYQISIIVDKEWLNDDERVYPVIIDPTVSDKQSDTSVIDTFIYNGDANVTTYNRPDLKVGPSLNNLVYRTLLKFELPKIPAGYKIVEASLELVSSLDAGVTGELIDNKICVHKLTKDWTESSAKWSNMHDAYDSKIYDYFISVKSTLNEYGGAEANITKLVQEWYNNPNENYGLMLKDYDEEYSEDNELNIFYSKDIASGNLKPTLSIQYKDFNGLESYLSYTSQQHYFGNSHISNYTGNLTTIFNVGNTIGGQLPANLYLVYNTTDVELNKNYGYGIGIKPNLLQTISKTQEEGEPLKFLDEDGTNHYFYPKYEKDESGKLKKTDEYHDEDGLDLVIKLQDTSCIMTDKNANTNKFINHNGTYYLEEITDTNNKTIKIIYNNNLITKVIDANNNEINITFENNKITFISPHITTEVNYTNNKLTSITTLGDTETIIYNNKGLIEEIINPNGLKIKYEYISDISYKVSKVSEISREGNIGNYLLFNYNYDDTKITDNKGRTSTYIFNDYGNVVGITSLENEDNLVNAYGKSYSFGSKEEGNANKLTADKSLVQYIDNLIDDSSFENGNDTLKCFGSITKSYTSDARTGKKAVLFTIDPNGEVAPSIYETFLVYELPDCDYLTLSFYAKGDAFATMVLRDGSFFLNFENIKLTNEFQRYSITCNMREIITTKLNLSIEIESGTKFIIDDMQLEEGEVANYYNLIDNSSFKDGTNGWEIDICPTEWDPFDQEPKEAYTEVVDIANTSALKIHSAPLDTVIVTKKFNISGKKGETFNLSFWYKNEGIFPNGYLGGMGNGVSATIFFYYNDIGLDGSGIPLYPLNVGSDNWQFFSENFTTEFDYDNFEVRINSFSNANDCYVTNFSLFKDLESYSYTYDDNGNLVSSTSLNKEKSEMKYDKNNQLISTLSPMGSNYTFEYDNKVTDRCLRAISPSGITNQVIYDANGNPIKTIINNRNTLEEIDSDKLYYIRAKGTNKYFYVNPDKSLRLKEAECSYDKFYIIKKVTKIDEDQELITYKFKHAILNNYYIKIVNDEIMLMYGDYDNEVELWDNMDGTYSIQKVKNNSDEVRKVFSYNDVYNLILDTFIEDYHQEFFFERADSSKLFIESHATYTDDGRFIKSVKDSLDNEISYDINPTNGLTNSITDPNGNSTYYTYDDKFRTTKITKGEHQVEYEYDTNNNLSKIKHGTKNYKFNYDEFNNTSSVQVNDRTLVNNYYEPNNGNLTKVKYGNNQEVNYTYDKFDRVKSIVKENATYTNYYDNLGRIVQSGGYNYEYDFAKRLSKYKDGYYVTEYDYDKDNKVVKKSEKLYSTHAYTYNYTYNKESALTKLNILNNNFNYIYDSLGRLVESNINDRYKTKYSYTSTGNRTSTQLSKVNDNGVEYSYTYDKLGNITEVHKDNVLTNKYYYDEHSQLIKEDNLLNNYTREYNYDNYGNILSKKTYEYNTTNLLKEDSYEYNDSSWQDLLTKFNNEEITYDEIGNPVSIGNKTLTWMNGRELSSYTDGTTNIQYKYNLDGIRTSKIVDGVETRYYLEGRTIIFENRNDSVIYYIYNGDELLGFKYDNNVYYYHKNISGDIIGILDANYNEIVTYEYDSFGNVVRMDDNSNINLGTINPFRYRSYYYDEEIGLYYLNSRYYNPKVGRFINADENLGSEDKNLSFNNFQYAFNNPINLVDEDGEWPKWAKAVVAATAAVAVVATVAVACAATGGLAGPLVGAAVGGVISGGVSAATQLATTGKIDGSTLAIDIVSGAVSGALSATPISLTASVVANSAIGVGSYVGTQILNDEKIDPVGVAINGIGGAVSGLISGEGCNGNKMINSFKRSTQKITRELRRQNAKYAAKVIAKETSSKAKISKEFAKSVVRTVSGAISNWLYKNKAGY